MGQTLFFMTPQQVFEELACLQLRHQFIVTLQRFEPPGGPGPAGLETVELRPGLGDYYNQEGFALVYLTQSAVPTHSRDWQFVAGAMSELVMIHGARLRDDVLEQAMLRVCSRPSKAEPLYRAFQRHVRKTCLHSMKLGDRLTSHVYYHPAVASLRLRSGFAEESFEYLPA